MRSQVIGSAARFALVAVVVLAPSLGHGNDVPEVTVVLDLPAPTQVDGAVVMDGAVTWASAGSPLLPVRTVRLLLPFGADPRRLEVEVLPVTVERWSLDRPVAPAPRQRPVGLPADPGPAAPDERIYGLDSLYPAVTHRVVGVHYLRGYPVLVLELYPVRVNPVRGGAEVVRSAKVRVRCPGAGEPTATEAARLRPSESDRQVVASTVENARALDAVPAPKKTTTNDWEYVVVTRSAMASAFAPLAAHRASADGFTTYVTSVESILTTYPGRDNAEKLRAFVLDGYSNHGTRYLVLGGDVDLVPTRGCYARAEVTYEDDSIPTDLYFGALDGDWNGDGDGRWCEVEDGVDLFPDVAVGRIAAGNATEAQRQVAKIIAYETWSAAPFHTLLVGEQADSVTWGGDMLDYVVLQMAGSPSDTLYERDGYWDTGDLLAYFNSDAMNVVNHMGHANETWVMKMDPSDAAGLSNVNPFFIYSQGCYAGAFDIGDCMAEQFTVKGNGGCHAVIMNSRYGWYAPGSVFGTSTLFQREFLQAAFEEGARRIGDAHDRSRSVLAGLAGVDGSPRWVAFDATLFGDPATPFHWQCTPTAARVAPESVQPGFSVMAGEPFVLEAAVHSACAGPLPGATATVSFDTGEPAVVLHDNGVAPDETAADGHFSGLWTPAAVGPVTLTFTASAAGLADGVETVTGQVVPGVAYTQQGSSTVWVDTSTGTTLSTGTMLGNEDDGGWVVALPFPFQFYGVTYADMMVDTNGVIQLEHGATYSATEESFPIPYAGDDNGLLAPWWCDLELGSGSVRTLVSGTAPQRCFTVEWRNVAHVGSWGAVTFQVTLYESSHGMVFRYQDTVFGDAGFDHGADATVGIECPNGVHAVQYSYHQPSLTDGLAIEFVPTAIEVGALFADGFDSGTMGAWSAVLP